MDPERTARVVARVIADSEAHRQALAIESAEELARHWIRVVCSAVALVAVGVGLVAVADILPWAHWMLVPLFAALGLAGIDFGIRPEDR